MSAHTVAAIPGDGIGHEVIPAARRVVDAVVDVEFVAAEAGDATRAETGAALPAATREVVADADATLFGAAGETAADVVLPLRSVVGSFVNVRPARAYPGVDALRPETDLVILRENTEGVYGGDGTRSDGRAELTRVITAAASERLAEFACDYVTERAAERAADSDATSGGDDPEAAPGFTLAHKANVMRETDGLFVERVESVAAERGVAVERALMDALATELCTDPGRFDTIVTPNLAGDVLSDLAAGLVGGLGLLPSANLGPEDGLFEPVHGSAPDIAGEGVANPTAAILSGAMLLEFLGEDGAAAEVRTAVEATLASGPRTPDLGGAATTEQFTDAVMEAL